MTPKLETNWEWCSCDRCSRGLGNLPGNGGLERCVACGRTLCSDCTPRDTCLRMIVHAMLPKSDWDHRLKLGPT